MGASASLFRKGEYPTEKDLDIITDNYLIEVKSDVQNVKFSQIEKYLYKNNPEYINVGDKKVIL